MSFENQNNHPINFSFNLYDSWIESWHAMCRINEECKGDKNEYVDLALLASSLDESNEEIVALDSFIEELSCSKLNALIDDLSGHMTINNIVHSLKSVRRSKRVSIKEAKIACIENLIMISEQAFTTAKEEQKKLEALKNSNANRSKTNNKAPSKRNGSAWTARFRHLLNVVMNDEEFAGSISYEKVNGNFKVSTIELDLSLIHI